MVSRFFPKSKLSKLSTLYTLQHHNISSTLQYAHFCNNTSNPSITSSSRLAPKRQYSSYSSITCPTTTNTSTFTKSKNNNINMDNNNTNNSLIPSHNISRRHFINPDVFQEVQKGIANASSPSSSASSPGDASGAAMRRPSIRIGGPGVDLSTGEAIEVGKDGALPWQPMDIQPEKPPPGFMSIDGFFDGAIQIDGKKYYESILILPQFVVSWKNVHSFEDVTVEHLTLPTIHYPAIRHLFIGCGYSMPCPTPIEFIEYMGKYKMTVEVTALATAVRLFNLQNTMFQNFACALVFEPDVTAKLHNIARKVDLGMEDTTNDIYSSPLSDDLYHRPVRM